ncbi:MAG TPA: SIS domain-containing protein [Rhodothermales bacterium]|nr:SIS domain-containing protein [Rhodothermales bacterium]
MTPETVPNHEALCAWLEAQADEAARVHGAVRAMTLLLVEEGLAMAERLRTGGHVFFFGNGGSAADAQHWAAELSGRFYFDRPPLAAHALPSNISQLTAIGNDYGYEEVFARPLRGMAHAGDLAVGISTSGTSANVLRAFEAGRERGTFNVGFCGARPEAMQTVCDVVVSIPVADTARVQEGHELAAHLVLALVERHLFGPR